VLLRQPGTLNFSAGVLQATALLPAEFRASHDKVQGRSVAYSIVFPQMQTLKTLEPVVPERLINLQLENLEFAQYSYLSNCVF
jgi:hypothetical protein